MSVWLVRHAEDLAAAERRFGDEALSPRGVEQARALGRAFEGVSLRGCRVSPLERALQTARIALGDRDVPVEITPSLAEGSIGDLAGLAYEAGARRYPRDFARGRTVVARLAAMGRTAPGGESRDAFLARAGGVAEWLADEIAAPGDPLLVVSHGGLLNYALQALFGLPMRDEVPFGFEHCGAVRIVGYSEEPDFGSFHMLRFDPPK